MTQSVGFDAEKYIQLQSEHIQARRQATGGKLYLEMGGKLFDDIHASRVLPGFKPDNKIAMLDRLKDELEILICIGAGDLERKKVRADHGISYDQDVLRLIDAFRDRGFLVNNVVITQYSEGNAAAVEFEDKLRHLGLNVARHFVIEGYPSAITTIASEEGFGANDYVETSRDLVVVTAPGPGSGKLATCLSQVYQDHHRGISSGYAKFETFPVWNLALDHPVNLAYEAATVDLDDVNVIDYFHLSAYGESAVNYNRDVEAFPLLKAMLQRLTGSEPYQSPTDMGVNMVGHCIVDDEVCRQASIQEIIRRYYKALVAEARSATEDTTISERAAVIMAKAGCTTKDRVVVEPALEIEERTGAPGAAMQLHDGTVVTGKTTELLGCSAGMLLNALKYLAGIDRELHLLSPESIEPIQTLKTDHLGSHNPRLHTDEVLIALSVSAANSEEARRALAQLKNLHGCDAHISTILGSVDESIFRNLGVQATSEPKFWKKRLYHKA